MNRTIRRLTVLAAAGGLLATTAACSTIAEPDNLVLQYTGGSADGTTFKDCIEPATKGEGVVNDHNFYLPTSERIWAIRGDGKGDTDRAIEGGTKPDANGNQGPKVVVYATIRFYLNTNCTGDENSPVVRWWEQVGRRKGADLDPEQSPQDQQKDSGWIDMLYATIVPKMETAVRNSTPQFTADQVDANLNSTYDKLAQAIAAELGKEYGKPGAFFCGPGYNRADANSCPAIDVVVTDGNYADPDLAKARSAVAAQELQARAREIETASRLRTAQELKKAGAEGLELQRLQNDLAIAQEQTKQAQACGASNPNCMVIVGSGAGVTVGAR